jgi:hypothetical protein
MWQLNKRERIMWVAWAVREGCFMVGYDAEPMFAGYVSDRERLWGARCLRESGAWWLPQLVTHSLLVPNESLPSLAGECQTALDGVETLAAEAGCAVADVRQALENIVRVTGEAQANGGWLEIHSRWPPYPGIPQVRL